MNLLKTKIFRSICLIDDHAQSSATRSANGEVINVDVFVRVSNQLKDLANHLYSNLDGEVFNAASVELYM